MQKNPPLPVPGEDATARQWLDLAAVVALDRISGDHAVQMVSHRAMKAYRALYLES